MTIDTYMSIMLYYLYFIFFITFYNDLTAIL